MEEPRARRYGNTQLSHTLIPGMLICRGAENEMSGIPSSALHLGALDRVADVEDQ